MILKCVEIVAVALFWIIVTPLTVILCKNQKWIPWNEFNFWQCIGTLFVFVIVLAGFSWLLFIIPVLLYRKLKRFLTNRSLAAEQEIIHLSRQPSECILSTQNVLNNVARRERDVERARPSRPAPGLPLKSSKVQCNAVHKEKKRRTPAKPPPSYDEIQNHNYL